MINTQGMVLVRHPHREYDEKILFYTEVLGKIWVYAFGSRSPKSFRGQSLGEFGWLDLELMRKGNRYLLKSLTRRPIPNHHRNSEYFLSWTTFLKILSDKIPGATPTPEIFSLLNFLSGSDAAKWKQSFREFTWYFSVLMELGLSPNFSHCQHCRAYCSDGYFFSLPGEVVGNGCISQFKRTTDHDWFPDQLSLEDIFFLNYCQEKYTQASSQSFPSKSNLGRDFRLDFFSQAFALAERLSESDSLVETGEINSTRIIRHQGRKLFIRWDRILLVLQVVLKY